MDNDTPKITAELDHPGLTRKLNPDDLGDKLLKEKDRRTPVLIIMQGAEIGRRHVIRQPSITMGRDPEKADVSVLEDQWISSVHLIITTSGNNIYVEDAGSTNGTFLNGKRISRRKRLAEGDKLMIGKTVFKFTLHDAFEDKFHRQLEFLMNVDELTRLPVKRVFQAMWQRALDKALAGNAPMSVLMMDMDGLKTINDTHGHHVGAGTIAEVGRLLGELIIPQGCVTRFGGDEFCAYVENCDRRQGKELGEKIRRTVADHRFIIDDIRVRPTISIGVSSIQENGRSVGELFISADAALYAAKKQGKNCVSC